MRDGDDIDRILGAEPQIVPSPGFTAAVMRAVHEAATAPPPIPFPWRRALPGLAAGCVALLALLLEVSTRGSGGSPAQLAGWLSALAPLLRSGAAGGGYWVLFAVLTTYVSLRVSQRLARPTFTAR